MHKFAIIAISGLAVSAVSLGIAGSMAARSGKVGLDLSWFDDLEELQDQPTPPQPAASLDWDGGDEVDVSRCR